MPGTEPAAIELSVTSPLADGLRWAAVAAVPVLACAMVSARLGAAGLEPEILLWAFALRLGQWGALLGVPLWLFLFFGGLNVVRTLHLPTVAAYRREVDPQTGATTYHVLPARNSRLAPLIPLLMGAVAAMPFYVNPATDTGLGFVVLAIGVAMSGFFLLPGARHRRPARIDIVDGTLTTARLRAPLGAVDGFDIGYQGLAIMPEPAIDGSRGVAASKLLGREAKLRQAPRSYVVEVRLKGLAAPVVLAGGLTPCCADDLVRDLRKQVARSRSHDRPRLRVAAK